MKDDQRRVLLLQLEGKLPVISAALEHPILSNTVWSGHGLILLQGPKDAHFVCLHFA